MGRGQRIVFFTVALVCVLLVILGEYARRHP
jgi:hypothetical protein